MICCSHSVKCECKRRYEAAIQERITVDHITNHNPAIWVNRIRHIKKLVSRGTGLDHRRSIKRTHIGSYTEINRYRASAGVGKNFNITGEIAVLRQEDLAGHVQ